jgi:hypothetical protein
MAFAITHRYYWWTPYPIESDNFFEIIGFFFCRQVSDRPLPDTPATSLYKTHKIIECESAFNSLGECSHTSPKILF